VAEHTPSPREVLSDSSSLLDRRATGGLRGWGGFSAQVRYILISLPQWLREPDFESFQPERLEDVDVFRRVNGTSVTEHHQVKTSELGPGDAKRLIEDAFERLRGGAPATPDYPSFVIATPRPHTDVKAAFDAVALFRGTAFENSQDARRATTLEDLKSRLMNSGVVSRDELADFVIGRVSLRTDWGGLEPSNDGWGRIAGELGQVPDFAGYIVDELTAAAKEFAHRLDGRKRYLWPREEICSVLRDTIGTYRAGPPRTEGDIVLLSHASRALVRAQPTDVALPQSLRQARRLPFSVEHPQLLATTTDGDLADALTSLFLPDGTFQNALALAGSRPLIYYGFPHIPLAALAGFLLGEQATVHLVEHDRETGTFAWPISTTGETPRLIPTSARVEGPGALVVRVSVSSRVEPALCRIATAERIAGDIDFSLDRPRRGVVEREAQVREYARIIRNTLDGVVVSGGDVSSVHVFAAVPVSLAFLIGQLSSFRGFPPTYVYNFSAEDSPPYRWAVCIQGASAGRGLHFVPDVPPST
jgi:hypothetical protein